MFQFDDMLLGVAIADPAVEAVLSTLTVTEEMATRVRAETELLEGETRQILVANRALRETVLSSAETVQVAVALARRWRL